MTQDAAVSQAPSTSAWITEIVGFLALFFGIAATDALFELHKLGQPFAILLFRAFVTAAISATALHISRGWRTR
jgi:hypothetical protein